MAKNNLVSREIDSLTISEVISESVLVNTEIVVTFGSHLDACTDIAVERDHPPE